MNRWTVLFAAMLFSMIVAIGCSNGNGVGPVAPASSPDITGSINGQSQTAHAALLGYYEITLDPVSQTMEVVADRTADYTINIVPFLNQMPGSGISFGSLDVDSSDPDMLKVDVNFQWTHPFPTIDQYKVYDFMGVIISNGDSTTKYKTLKVGKHLANTYMSNADGYTRWFNPTEFTTTLIFGWAPGGIQNLAGNAKLNPYKYYAKGLSSTGDVWDFITGGSNNDGVFQSGAGRLMSLEFPNPPAGDGLTFAYAAVCCWEEQGAGPYTPYHRPEAIACQATITPSLYFTDATHQGGDFIADIDVWAWGNQPDSVKVESTVLTTFHDTDPGVVGGDNYSTYHIDVPKDVTLTGTEGHEFWVIAENSDLNYINVEGVAAPSASVPLAAFWRFPLYVSPVAYNEPPIVDSGVTGEANPFFINAETYSVTAHDPDADPLTYSWTVSFDGTPLDDYNGVPGDGAGNLDVDWAPMEGEDGDLFVVSCDVSDGPEVVAATPLDVTISTLLYEWYGVDDGNGNMTIMSGGLGPTWTWVSASKVWDENGNINSMYGPYSCTTLETPSFNVPAGNYQVRVEYTVSGDLPSDPYNNYGICSGMAGYSPDNGTSWVWNAVAGSQCVTPRFWLSDSTGTNFNWDTCQYNLGLYGENCMSCYYYGYYGNWEKRIWGRGIVAPFANPVTGNWACEAQIKGNAAVRLGFNFNQGMYSWGGNGNGLQIHKIKVYGAPAPPPPPAYLYTCDSPAIIAYDSAFELTSGYSVISGVDDGGYFIPSLPFTFDFAGQHYSSLTIQVNGGISFGNNTDWNYAYGCPMPWRGYDQIWAVTGDLDSYCYGEIRYGTKTVNSIQYFIIQWVNYAEYYCYSSNDFMIVLANTTQADYDPFMVQWLNINPYYGHASGFNYQPGGTATTCCMNAACSNNTACKQGDW